METAITIKIKFNLKGNITLVFALLKSLFLLYDKIISLVSIKILTSLMQGDICHVTVCLPQTCLTSLVYCTRGLRKSIPVSLDLCRQTIAPQLVQIAYQKCCLCHCGGGQVIADCDCTCVPRMFYSCRNARLLRITG